MFHKSHVMGCLTMLGLISAMGSISAATSPVQIDEKKIEGITLSVSPSVVKVEARNGVRKVATGVIIDKDGSIITTALISPRDEEISVITFDGKKYKAEFKGFDMESGLAVIQVKENGLKPISLGKSTDIRTGAWIGAIGFSPENTPAVTQGIVSSSSPDRIRLNLWVMPGSSGSPIVNSEGRMIGVLRGTYVDNQPLVFEFREQQVVGSGTVISRAEAPSSGMALAVPVDVVLSVATDIRKEGKVLRGWIGVRVAEGEGRLEIVQVEPKSPAELAKIKEGDQIIKIEGKDATSGMMFSQEIRNRKPGTTINLVIQRDDVVKDVKVKLGEYTEEDGRRELEDRFPGLFFPPQNTPRPTAPLRNLDEFFKWENRKYIGLTIMPLTKDLAGFFGAKEGKGLLVTEFPDEDSPAKASGLKIGDVILKADGRVVESVNDISDLIQKKKKGEKIRFEILRDKKSLTIDIPVSEQEDRGPETRSAREAFDRFRRDFEEQINVTPRSGSEGLKSIQEKLKTITEKGSKGISRIVTSKGAYYRI